MDLCYNRCADMMGRGADSVKCRLVLLLAHPSNPGQSPEGRKMDACVDVQRNGYAKVSSLTVVDLCYSI